MSKRLDIFISVCVAVVLGTTGFYAGIYYGFMKSEEYVETLLNDFEKISDDVNAYKKVSDPKTIRLYVKELNKILDDVTFLGKMVESGQIASESLDLYFKEYEDNLDETNDMIFGLHDELTEIDYKFKEQVYRLTGETDDNLELIDANKKAVLEEVGRMYDRIDLMYKDLEDVSKNMEKIKNSKLAKYLE